MYVSAFFSISARVSCGRVVFLPEGSPIMPVKSPIEEDDPVARVLEVLHLAQEHRVAEMDVGRRGVEAHFDRQRAPGDLAGELPLLDEVDGAAAQMRDLLRGGSHGGRGLYGAHTEPSRGVFHAFSRHKRGLKSGRSEARETIGWEGMDEGKKRLGFLLVAAAGAALLGARAASDTLHLNASHPFDVRLVAKDQHHGGVQVVGNAIPQTDVFGYFSFPPPTGSLDNPEVFVKLLDGTTINGQFWVFYGHLTDLEYTLSVTEVGSGHVKNYHKDPGTTAGGFDTDGFNFTPTPGGGSSTTPTPPPATPTPTPTPPAAGAVTINVSVARYSYSPGTGTPIMVNAGQPTTLVFESSDTRHGFSGIPGLGVAGFDNITPETPPGDDGYGYTTPGSPAVKYTVTFTAPLSARGQTFGFSCTAPGVQGCGPNHTSMQGTLRVN